MIPIEKCDYWFNWLEFNYFTPIDIVTAAIELHGNIFRSIETTKKLVLTKACPTAGLFLENLLFLFNIQIAV